MQPGRWSSAYIKVLPQDTLMINFLIVTVSG
jgi:hypothetical protein